jgi:predicted MFS family arabinose efflux permease
MEQEVVYPKKEGEFLGFHVSFWIIVALKIVLVVFFWDWLFHPNKKSWSSDTINKFLNRKT